MKTVIAVSDELSAKVKRLAKVLKKSRSQLYSDALREYVARHAPDQVTEALNEVCAEMGDDVDAEFLSEVSQRTLQRSEW